MNNSIISVALLGVATVALAFVANDFAESAECQEGSSCTVGSTQWHGEDSHMEAVEDTDCQGCLEGTQLLQVHLEQSTIAENPAHVAPLPKSAASLQLPADLFHHFLKKHGREYAPGTPDYELRHKLFIQRSAEAETHNSKPDRLWTAGINKLADRSDKELRELLGWNGRALPGAMAGDEMPPSFLQISGVSSVHSWGHGTSNALPKNWNWGNLNATRRIHDQGPCGSCWAVSSVSVLQAHVEIHTPAQARPLSVQELVSCVDNPRHCGGNGACDGATAELAMDYAMRYGLASTTEAGAEAVAPAEDAAKGSPTRCPKRNAQVLLEGLFETQVDKTAVGVHQGSGLTLSEGRTLGIRAWERLPPNSYAPLMHALVERGPAAVAVFASKWFTYSHGIFDSCQKDAVIDHAVALIGYGHDRKFDAKYWLIQNSWGPEWGENGRIRLLRKSNDETEYCGIDGQPKEGTGCDGGPAQVKVCGMCGILYDTVVPHL